VFDVVTKDIGYTNKKKVEEFDVNSKVRRTFIVDRLVYLEGRKAISSKVISIRI